MKKDGMSTPLLDALSDHLKKTPLEELRREWQNIRSMGFQGPTIEEYLNQYNPNRPAWISVEEEKPVYYKEVIIFDGEEVYYRYHRMADEDGEFYGSMDSKKIIEKITHWMPLIEKPKKEK